MLDDRDHRPVLLSGALHPDDDLSRLARLTAARDRDDDIGCAFWAAMLALGLIVLLAGYGLAALSDRVLGALLAVLP